MMIKKSLIIPCLLCLSITAFSQKFKGTIDSAALPALSSSHYVPEYLIDVSTDPGKWNAVAKGLNAAIGSNEELYFRTEVPEGMMQEWSSTGWKGEKLNTQVVIWSPDTLNQVRVKISDLRNAQGAKIDKKNIDLNMVRYVIANFPYGSDVPDCSPSPHKNGFLMPDRFEAFESFDLPGKTVRPVWISVNIPQNASAGTYTGTVEVVSKNNAIKKLPVKIVVQNKTLPKPQEWSYRLDLWQNPWIIADYYHVKPWGEEHIMLLKKHLKLYADAGGTYITTYGVHSPWGDNEYGIEGGMIQWMKKKDGSWKFDYSIFDKYVELCMSLGIDKAITIYTPLPWGERFWYTEEATGDIVKEQWLPTDPKYKKNINAFLTDLKLHLQKKGWMNKTYIGINENAMSQTLASINVIKQHSKDWKITYAGDYHKELDELLDDYCFLYGKESDIQTVKARAARGQTTTYYVCCNPAKPNNFLFSPPVEGRFQGWYAMAHGYNGFLRWAYDAWPEDPMRDARYGSWAAGDCYLVYPGGNSCIRYEKMREGIVDFEKIRILKGLAQKSANSKARELVKELDKLLESFSVNPVLTEDRLKTDVKKGNDILQQLSALL